MASNKFAKVQRKFSIANFYSKTFYTIFNRTLYLKRLQQAASFFSHSENKWQKRFDTLKYKYFVV